MNSTCDLCGPIWGSKAWITTEQIDRLKVLQIQIQQLTGCWILLLIRLLNLNRGGCDLRHRKDLAKIRSEFGLGIHICRWLV